MQQEHKLNGYSYQDFEKIGVPARNLYRYKKQNLTQDEMLKKAFENKYGKIYVSKYFSFENYYYEEMVIIAHQHFKHRIDRFKELKKDFYKSCTIFELSRTVSDQIWDRIGKKYMELINILGSGLKNKIDRCNWDIT